MKTICVSKTKETNDMKIEIASFLIGQTARYEGFMQGAKAVLKHIPNPSGNDPMDIEVEFSEHGCKFYLLTGPDVAEEIKPQSGAVLCPACGKCDWKYTYRSPVDPAHDKFKCVCGREWQRYS
jgi:hypothetical protein